MSRIALLPVLASWLLLVLALAAALPDAAAGGPRRPVTVLFDTDIGPDVDDAGATAVLHALADRGEARLIGMGCCTSSRWGAPCLQALNTYYGRPDLPVGTLKRPGFLDRPDTEKYNRALAERFPNQLRSGERAPEAAALYRRLLAAEPDGSVVVVAVGPLPNLARLLDSRGDATSPLGGVELVRRKVARLVVMGGRFPEGKEWNFEQDAAAARAVAERWPTRVLYSGFEIGARVFTGLRIQAKAPAHPVGEAYRLYVPGKSRESWDLTAALAAVRGPGAHWTESPRGRVTVREDGSNGFRADPAGPHTYLIERDPPERVAEVLDGLIEQPPGRRE